MLTTAGQHPPLYDKLYPYSAFPKRIEGPTVWKPEDYANNPERWVHQFSEPELAEISETADKFMDLKLPLTGITKENFPLLNLAPALETMRRELINGKGFICRSSCHYLVRRLRPYTQGVVGTNPRTDPNPKYHSIQRLPRP